eukprot:13750254-Ditylum_brightwellii.AAC.1
MSRMFANIEEVHMYINNLMLITTRSWENHPEQLDEVLDRLTQVGLKVKAIIKIAPPTTKKQLCSLIGMINYYCNM